MHLLSDRSAYIELKSGRVSAPGLRIFVEVADDMFDGLNHLESSEAIALVQMYNSNVEEVGPPHPHPVI